MFAPRIHLVITLFNAYFSNQIDAKCPSGYIQGLTDGACHYVSHDTLNWYDAEDDCRNRGGHLASITGAFMNSFLYRSGSSCTAYWVGASRGVTTSTNWTWTDGSAFKWTNWASGEPRPQAPLCLALDITVGTWYSSDCAQTRHYICTVTSKYESSRQCPSGWTYFSVTNKCYSLLFNIRFYEALTQCENEGATLASIHSSEANEALLGFAAKNLNLTAAAWIGLHSPGNVGTWEWTDGSAFDFNNWDVVNGFPLKTVGSNRTCAYGITDVRSTEAQERFQSWHNYALCESVEESAICQKDPEI